MQTLILVNVLTSVSSFVYQSHLSFVAHLTRKYPNDKFLFYTPHRQTIDTSRNLAAKIALESNCDYLMFLDDDVLIHPDAFDKLYEADKDIIAGLVYLRGYPFHVMAFKELPRELVKIKDKNGNETSMEDPRMRMWYADDVHEKAKDGEVLVPVDAVGFSCCLIKTDVLKAMEPPYFVTGPLNTEDVYFCLKTRNLEPRPSIYVHTGVRPGHLLNPEPIEFDNRLLLTNFYDNITHKYNDVVGAPENGNGNGRGLDYIQRNIKALG